MKTKLKKSIWQAISLGAIAGMRTSSAPLVVSEMLRRQPSKAITKSPLKFIQSDTFGVISKLMAAGELIADKLPSTGDRIAAGGIVGRGLSGALAGACIFKAKGHNVYGGAAIGFATAVGATFGSWWLRKTAGEKTKINDLWLGGLEDVITASAGFALIKS